MHPATALTRITRAHRAIAGLLFLLLACVSARGEEQAAVRVYAAASLTGVMNDIAALWQQQGHPRPLLVLAGTPTLAKQIVAGARADVFVAADSGWMDYLADRGRIDPASRTNLLGNALVLIAPRARPFRFDPAAGPELGASFAGRLCTGETSSVPVGLYAREALESTGAWASVAPRIVGLDDSLAALALVARGECGAGIVYATDAASSPDVVIVWRFPAATHRPIVYPAALVRGGEAHGAALFDFLRSAPAARQVFERHGFLLPRAGD
jgi:molybdate transport system substrate-binding protein